MVPKATLNALMTDKAKLKAVLLYHVVAGKLTAKDVAKLSSAKTANGKSLAIRDAGGNVFVKGCCLRRQPTGGSAMVKGTFEVRDDLK